MLQYLPVQNQAVTFEVEVKNSPRGKLRKCSATQRAINTRKDNRMRFTGSGNIVRMVPRDWSGTELSRTEVSQHRRSQLAQ